MRWRTHEGDPSSLIAPQDDNLRLEIVRKLSTSKTMEVQTIQKYIHTPPRKLRLVADMVREMTPGRSLDVLRLTPKMAARDLIKAIETVLANAKNKGLDASKLNFAKIEINESAKMRRFRAGTRGRVKPYKRRMSHIKIILSDDLNLKSQISKLKTGKQEEKIEKHKEAVLDDSAVKNKSTKGGRTESSK